MSSPMVGETWCNVSCCLFFSLTDFGHCWITYWKKIDFFGWLDYLLTWICLQTENLEKLIFLNKKWPYDPIIRCKSPFNLREFLEMDIDLEDGLEEFEGDFEKDEVVEVWKWNKKMLVMF